MLHINEPYAEYHEKELASLSAINYNHKLNSKDLINTMKHIFGPVNSRRFGLSLGIDLSTATKQCNFDCVYCELTRLKPHQEQHTITPPQEILGELKNAFVKYPNLDVLTITANGEPTMYPHLQELIDGISAIKSAHKTDTKTLILSNASTISNPAIQKTLTHIDIVKLSLDAVNKKTFRRIDRPHREIDLQQLISGIIAFKKIHRKELVIEVLFVKGINDDIDHIKALNATLLEIKPHRIDISTIDRPPAYKVSPLSNSELFECSTYFDASLDIHIAYNKKQDIVPIDFCDDDILEMIRRRPQNEDDVLTLFSPDAQKRLLALIAHKKVWRQKVGENIYFVEAR